MRHLILCTLLISAAGACASRDARSASTGTTPAIRSAGSAAGTARAGDESRWRAMTWDEYYSQVMDRAWRRGGEVIWIDPPRVRAVTPAVASSGFPFQP